MYNNNPKQPNSSWYGNSRGVTLIELVIALAITFVVTGAAYAVLAQLFHTNIRSTNHMVAFREVQSAGYWISRDGLMVLQIDDTAALINPTDILRLRWTDWRDDGQPDVVHDVLYSWDNGRLSRHDVAGGATNVIASHILNPDDVEATFTDSDLDGTTDTIVFDITVTVGSEVETRTYEVVPRTHIK
jgi:prepilin-type N-terminal cleavage/methylation domain-containing protein